MQTVESGRLLRPLDLLKMTTSYDGSLPEVIEKALKIVDWINTLRVGELHNQRKAGRVQPGDQLPRAAILAASLGEAAIVVETAYHMLVHQHGFKDVGTLDLIVPSQHIARETS